MTLLGEPVIKFGWILGLVIAAGVTSGAASQVNDLERTAWRALSPDEQRAEINQSLDMIRAEIATAKASGDNDVVLATYEACLGSKNFQETGVERLRGEVDEAYSTDWFACRPVSKIVLSAVKFVCRKEFEDMYADRMMAPPPLPPSCD